MEKKELYSVPEIEEIKSSLTCAVGGNSSGGDGEGMGTDEPDNQGGLV